MRIYLITTYGAIGARRLSIALVPSLISLLTHVALPHTFCFRRWQCMQDVTALILFRTLL